MRCTVCGKSKWGQVLINGVCPDCMAKQVKVQRNPKTGVGFITAISTGTNPGLSILAMSGSFPSFTAISPTPLNGDTMDEQLARVDTLAPLSRDQREAAKRAIRRVWGEEE